MPQNLDESGLVPDDRLLVRPYVAPSGRLQSPPSPSSAPAWPESGPLPFPGPAPTPAPVPVRVPAPERETASAATGRDRRGSRLPLAALTLFALAAAGALVFLLSGPDPEPERAVPPFGLSVPVLPARSLGAGEPGPEASVRSHSPSAPATSPTGSAPPASPGPTAGQSSKPTPPPTQSPTAGTGTLRPGDRGPEVRDLQERLYAQGFTYVSVTGVYDGQTRRGVAQLQSDRDIKGDPKGVYGPATRAAFG